MTQRLQVYKCGVCGNMVEVIHASGGTLVCCGQEMNLLAPGTTDAATEKHVPVITKTGDGQYKVAVGEVQHPMANEHYIEWIQLVAGDKAYRKFLNPGEKPEAVFDVDSNDVYAREYCNLHGLWKA